MSEDYERRKSYNKAPLKDQISQKIKESDLLQPAKQITEN
jgi:hypothetical protein